MRPAWSVLRGAGLVALLIGAAWLPLASLGPWPMGSPAGGAGAVSPPPAPELPLERPERAELVQAPRVETLGRASPYRPPVPLAMVAEYRQPGLVADYCVDRDLLAPPPADPVYTVLDRSYALPPGDAPPDLVPASHAGFATDQLLRAGLIDDLAALGVDSAAAGLELIVESGYRSYEQQLATLNYWIGVEGYELALLRTARPGHSEHQLGTAIDVVSPGWAGRFGDWALESAEGAWMAEHAWEYGFVMSYPAGSQAATCFGYEPWHYRWIGREAAAEHRVSGLPLRLYLVRHVTG